LRLRTRWSLGLAGLLLAGLYAPACLRILTAQDLGSLGDLPAVVDGNGSVPRSLGQSQLVP
jgi:hypothetical protein